jgi:uncharacterized glyoxalase superfamily protein PhnB
MSKIIPAPPAPPNGPSDWTAAVHGNSFTNLQRLRRWIGGTRPVPLTDGDPSHSFQAVPPGSLGGGALVNIYVVAHGWAPGYRKAVQQEGGNLLWWDSKANVGGVWASNWAWSPVAAPLSHPFPITIGMLPSIVAWDPNAIVLAYSWIDESATGGDYDDKDEVYRSEAYTHTNGIRLANALEEAIAAPFWSSRANRLHLIGHSHGSKVATVAALTLQGARRRVAQLTILDAPESDIPLYANGANLLGFYLELLEIASPPFGPAAAIVAGAFVDNYASYFGVGYTGAPRLNDVIEVALAPSQLYDRDDLGDQHSYAAAFYAGAAAGSRAQNEPPLGLAWPPPPSIYQPALNQGWPAGTTQKSQWSLQAGTSILGSYGYGTQPLEVTEVHIQGRVVGNPDIGLRFSSAGAWPAYSIFSGTYPNPIDGDGYGIAFGVYWSAPQPGDYLVVTAESPEEHAQEVLLVMDGVSAPRGPISVAINIDVSGTVPFHIYYLAAAGNENGEVVVSHFRQVCVTSGDGHLRRHRLARAQDSARLSTLPANRSMPPGVVIPELGYADVHEAAAWLCRAFGFVERLRIGDHRVQLSFGAGSMVVTEGPQAAPERALTHSVMVRVADADAHCERARQAGAVIVRLPTDYPFGERQYTAEDPGGHRWTFSQTIADADPASWGGTLLE